jgi:hypothetical protein
MMSTFWVLLVCVKVEDDGSPEEIATAVMPSYTNISQSHAPRP